MKRTSTATGESDSSDVECVGQSAPRNVRFRAPARIPA